MDTTNMTKLDPITPAEFMERMQIKRSTFNNWKKTGRLVRGRHFMQAGSVIRIFWSMELLKELDDPPPDEKKDSATKKKPAAKRTAREGCRVNLNI